MAPPKRSERAPYTLDSLTDVAVRIFTERGYDATRMEHIARAANISKSSVYHHVTGKEDFLRHAAGRALGALWAVLEQPESNEGDELARLVHIMRQIMAAQLRLQAEMSLLQRVQGNTPTERWARAERARFSEHIAGLVGAAQAAGHLLSGHDPALLVHLVFSMADSVVEWFRPDGTWSHRQVVDTVIEVMLDGTRRPRPPATPARGAD
ncbi:TetR/AcrR family transcriptional regulator [Pseudonocardia eucalypti]|uniref:TetR/AcrR family transcriptional regulator n=1 Tax=Pseudonocardia eucalypti TaxID=648755 RepID=A0ABP9RE45_9PSEU|nr:AcrR family transcriptional regulator [Pseudonocardia eucalypti]